MRLAAPVVLAAGLLAVLVGVQPWPAALAVAHRVAPVLGFLLLVAVLADLCRDAGLFDVVAHGAARLAGGSVARLYGAFVLVCVATTWLLSLDTTAVLLTPVALVLARRLRLDPRPFAFATLWLANTASLMLPVANLTNLLAVHRLALPTGSYLRLVGPPQAAVLLVTVVVLAWRHRGRLRGRYLLPEGPPVATVPVAAAGAAALGLGVAVVLGAEPWVAALGALVPLVVALGLHDPSLVRPGRLLRLAPWSMAALAVGLFLLVDAVCAALPLQAVVPSGEGALARLGVAALGALGANVVDNLPAYLAIEPHADGPRALAALLVGVNAGALLTPWGSLATLLWLRALRGDGLDVTPRELLREGLWVVPAVVVAGALAA